MSQKVKNGLADLDTLINTDSSYELSDNIDWGFSIDETLEKTLLTAVQMRTEAFELLDRAKIELPTLDSLKNEIKIMRARLDGMNKDISKDVAKAWAKFRRTEPVRAIFADSNPAIMEKVKAKIDADIDKSDHVAARNLLWEQIESLQARIDEIENLRPDAFGLFADAKAIAVEAGLDPAIIGWEKSN